jgi:2,4-dienoyl-CoA reductase-like NADH-dependent reductase (Old Yellow Enzyme family)
MPKITEPLQINSLLVKNRLVMPPMATSKSNAQGEVSNDLIAYYDQRSQGESVGMIITEHAYIDKAGQAHAGQLSVSKEEDIEGLKKLTDKMHENSTPIICQISHAGGRAKTPVTGHEVVGPSAILLPRSSKDAQVPRELSIEEIQKIPALFAKAALRAKAAGYDGVEIHSAHGYLLDQFYSPLANKRTDIYGGSIENRIRLHKEVIQAVREAVGEDYPVFLRLGALDYLDGGASLEDAVTAAKEFEQAGIDLLDISGGFNGYIRPGYNEPGYFKDASEAIKSAVSIPVLLTGGISQIEQAQALLDENAADLIGVGRALFKDGDWAKKELAKLKD